MVHDKDIRTYTLLLFLLIVGAPLQAAQLYEEEGKVNETRQGHPVIVSQDLEVYDHTRNIGKQVNNEVHEIKELQDCLVDEIFLLANELEKNAGELMLAAVLRSKGDQRYYKYLFSSKGLLQGKTIVDKAYKNRFKYHLIKATSPHVVSH